MNAFFVPRLGSMIYTMNGMTTQLHLQADHAGRYLGQSSQFSGDGFASMHFDTDAVPAAEFDAWVAQTQRSGPILDAAGYDALVGPSEAVKPFTYRAVAPGLFDAIVMRTVGTDEAGTAHDPAAVTAAAAAAPAPHAMPGMVMSTHSPQEN